MKLALDEELADRLEKFLSDYVNHWPDGPWEMSSVAELLDDVRAAEIQSPDDPAEAPCALHQTAYCPVCWQNP